MNDLDTLRRAIDQVDREVAALFARRMELCGQVAAYKKEHGLPVLDAGREQEKLDAIAAQLPPELQEAGRELYTLLFRLSRQHQTRLLSRDEVRP